MKGNIYFLKYQCLKKYQSKKENKVLKLQVLKVKLIINYQLFKTLFKGFYLSLVSKE